MVKSSVAVPNYNNTDRKGTLQTYYKVVNFFLKRCDSGHNISNLDNDISGVEQEYLTLTIFAKQLS